MKLEYILRNIASRIAYALSAAKAYINQQIEALTYFGSVAVNSTTMDAQNKSDTLKIKSGTGISLSADPTTREVTISSARTIGHDAGSLSLRNDTNSELTTISVTKVPAILCIGAMFDATSATGRRRIWLSNGAGSTNIIRRSFDSNGEGIATIRLNASGIITTAGTYYLNGYQNSGEAATVAWEWDWLALS